MRCHLMCVLAVGVAGACADSTGPASFGPPAVLQIVAGNLQSDTVGHELADPLVIRVVDAAGHPVSGQIINYRVTAGGGEVFAGVGLTDDSGQSRERWTLGTVAGDTQRVEARAVDTQTGDPIVFGTFVAVGTPDLAASVQLAPAGGGDSLVFVAPGAVLAGDSLSLVAVAHDRFGNLKGGPTVAWSSNAPAIAGITAGGLVRALAPGAALITGSVDTASASMAITVRPLLPATLVLVDGANQSDTIDATLSVPVSLQVLDLRDRPFAGATVRFQGQNGAPTDTTAGCSCKVVTTNAAGIAATDWVLGSSPGVASLQAIGSAPGGPAFDTVSVTAQVTHGNAFDLISVSGGQAATGLLVAVRDRIGNPVAGASVAWAILSGTGTLSASLSISDVNGLAGTSVLGATDTLTVAATAAGIAGSVEFTVTAPEPASLEFGQSWVTVSDHADLDLDSIWTIELWIKPQLLSGLRHIVSKWNGGGNASYTLETGTTGHLRSGIHDGLTTQAIESFAALTVGAWQHVAITLDRGTLSLYINGLLDHSITGSLMPMNSDRPLSFGREGPPSAGRYYNGLIDEVRIWRVARTAAQLTAGMNVRLTGLETGLVGYWRLDEGAGDMAFDGSGRGHNGRLGHLAGPDGNDPIWRSDTAPIP